jgi:hypothetical protein
MMNLEQRTLVFCDPLSTGTLVSRSLTNSNLKRQDFRVVVAPGERPHQSFDHFSLHVTF